MMKRLLAALLALILPFSGAQALMQIEEAAEAARADFPDWQIWDTTEYGSGRWEDQIARHGMINLMKMEGEYLRFRQLHAMLSLLEKGQPIPWEIEDWAPLPMNSEAAARIAAMAPKEIMGRYSTGVSEEALPGCGEFLLGEGEKIAELYVYSNFLLAIAEDAAGRQGFRIGHWNGEAYDKITVSPMQEAWFAVNDIHSWDDYLEIMLEDGEAVLSCGEDGIWRLTYVNNGWQIYSIGENRLIEHDDYLTGQNNWLHYYGKPLFPWTLEELQFHQLPQSMEEAVLQLDTNGIACVKQDGAAMYREADGEIIANCYQKLTGTVVEERDEWVCLQLGSEEKGIRGWFQRDDLAFGKEIHTVECTFPSYASEVREQEGLLSAFGVEDDDAYYAALWLIGKMSSGDWLVLLEDEIVFILPEDKVFGIGPAEKPGYLLWEAEEDMEEEEDMEIDDWEKGVG